MKILVVGGGGRCHAIVDAIGRSTRVEKIYCAPGNAGIARQAQTVPIKDTDIDGLLDFAKTEAIDLTVVGPEAALALGIVDRFEAEGLRIFGPTKAAARIESSKEFAKELMRKYSIPTASYRTFTDYAAASEYVTRHGAPIVLKYDGLAAGKGVVVAMNNEEADSALRQMLQESRFGQGKVVVEEYLEGPEFSFMCFVSGREVIPMPLAQDHKRAFDGDRGGNTGGMGAYTTLPYISEEERLYALEHIMRPMAEAMVAEGVPFKGVLYGGLMKTEAGIKVIEFNARFGDPETEVVLPCLESDIVDLFDAVIDSHQVEVQWSSDTYLGVVLASKGYPEAYNKGAVIDMPDKIDGVKIYHMGTAMHDGQLVTAGGRVMIVVAKGCDAASARARAIEAIGEIKCDNLFYRSDIGHTAIDK